MARFILHYGIHLLLPLAIGYFCFPKQRLRAILILLGGLLIDLDHLLAHPVYDPARCSIGFHPLHSYVAIGGYVLLLFFRKTRIFGIALLIHILADTADCLWLFFHSK